MGDVYDRETARAMLAGGYLQGRCTAFAIALHRRTGWPLVAVRSDDGRLWHSACRTPEGYADARGRLDEAALVDGFGGSDIVDADEATLLAEHPQDEAMIHEAGLHAEMLLDIPGTSPQRGSMVAFAAELHRLCVLHSIYLRGPGPGVSEGFVAYPAYGEEAGFEVAMFPLGQASLRRILR